MHERVQESADQTEKSSTAIGWAEMGLLPDPLIRAGIRRFNRQRLKDIHADEVDKSGVELIAFVEQMRSAEIAPLPELANSQHYEVRFDPEALHFFAYSNFMESLPSTRISVLHGRCVPITIALLPKLFE